VDIIPFLNDNAEWLLGGGGVAGVIFTLIKLLKPKKSSPSGIEVSGGTVHGDVVGRDKTTVTKHGFGLIEFSLAAALIIAAVGGVFLLAGPSITNISADNGSAAVQGNGNNVNVRGQ